MKRRLSLVLVVVGLFSAPALAKQGDLQDFGEQEWNAVKSMTALDGKVYVANPGALWEVDSKTGKSKAMAVPKDWGTTTAMTTMGGKLYCSNDKILYEVDKKGQVNKINGDLGTVVAMAPMDGKLYVVTSSRELYALDKNGKGTHLSDDWYKVDGMAEMAGKLYILSRDQLHEVDVAGQRKSVEGEPFRSPSAVASANGKLYVFASEPNKQKIGGLINVPVLWELDATGGKRERFPIPKKWIENGTWANTMTSLDGKLFMTAPGMSHSYFFALSTK